MKINENGELEISRKTTTHIENQKKSKGIKSILKEFKMYVNLRKNFL